MRPQLRRLALATLAALALPGLALADDALTPYDAQAREIFAKIISIPSSIGLGKVPEEANYLAGEFRKAGFPDEDIHVLPLGETASLVVRYRGDGSGGKPIVMMAHMDVVTAKREDWQRDPFTLVEENGYFYGRGTADVKEGVAELSATFIRLKKENFKPTRDLIIYFSGDEETDGATAQDTVKNHKDLVDAEFALNADGGGGTLSEEGKDVSYSLQTSEKTYASFELTTHNPGGHSSAPRPDNAIYELADALRALHGFQFPVMWNDTTIAYYKAVAPKNEGALGKAMADFAHNPKDQAAIDVLSAESGEVGKLRTTCVATMLRGGHAENALPQSATATVNCRIFPGHSVDDVKATLAKVAGDKVTVTTIGTPFPAPASPLRQDVLDAVTYAVHTLHPGVPIVPSQSSGASDGIYFRAAGIPTYGTGSSFIKDSDDFAHGLNERLPVKSFYQHLRHWDLIIKALAAPAKSD